MKKELISIVVPCMNEEDNIFPFYEAVDETMKTMKNVDYEIYFVNDGSKDHTLDKMRELAKKERNIHYLSFSRNFGKEAAMYAGLKAAKGD